MKSSDDYRRRTGETFLRFLPKPGQRIDFPAVWFTVSWIPSSSLRTWHALYCCAAKKPFGGLPVTILLERRDCGKPRLIVLLKCAPCLPPDQTLSQIAGVQN